MDIDKIAKVARLNLENEEKERFQKDLEGILEAFKEMDEVEADCEPSFQPTETKNTMREDQIEDCLSEDEIFMNTDNKENGFFKGPRAV